MTKDIQICPPQVLLMLERLIDYWKVQEGVRFVTFDEAADDFRGRFLFSGETDPRRSVGKER